MANHNKPLSGLVGKYRAVSIMFESVRCIMSVCLLCVILMSFTSCHTNQTLSYATVETVALATEYDGSYVLRVQGKGPTKEMAYANAKKKAIHDIIFKGIHTSFGDKKMIHPLISNPSVEKNNEQFFNKFFSGNG